MAQSFNYDILLDEARESDFKVTEEKNVPYRSKFTYIEGNVLVAEFNYRGSNSIFDLDNAIPVVELDETEDVFYDVDEDLEAIKEQVKMDTVFTERPTTLTESVMQQMEDGADRVSFKRQVNNIRAFYSSDKSKIYRVEFVYDSGEELVSIAEKMIEKTSDGEAWKNELFVFIGKKILKQMQSLIFKELGVL